MIFNEGALQEAATCKDYLQVRQEGSRELTVNQFAPYALFLAILLIAAAMEWVGRHRERSANGEGG